MVPHRPVFCSLVLLHKHEIEIVFVRIFRYKTASQNTHSHSTHSGTLCQHCLLLISGWSEGVSGVFALARCFEVLRDRLSDEMFSGLLASPGILLGDFSGDAGDASALGRSCQMVAQRLVDPLGTLVWGVCFQRSARPRALSALSQPSALPNTAATRPLPFKA